MLWLALAHAACGPELPVDAWATCWEQVGQSELSTADTATFSEQWSARPHEERDHVVEQLQDSDAAWWLGKALFLREADEHDRLIRKALARHGPGHDARALWYTELAADRVWTRWEELERRAQAHPTEANREAALQARGKKHVFWNHVLVLRRQGRDTTTALMRCMSFVGTADYCGEIEVKDETDLGW